MSNTENFRLPVPVNERDHVIGRADAPVTVVKYGDYESAGEAKLNRAIEKMTRQLLDRVRLVYRHFPLIYVHPRALRAAEAAEAAAAQGKFWEMNSLLYLNPGKLEDKELRKYAGQVGLDLDRFDHEMSINLYAEEILRDLEFSINHGITGTPTFFVNDALWAVTGVKLIEAVKALAKGKTLMEQ
jgi:formate-nitrite transporter family protein